MFKKRFLLLLFTLCSCNQNQHPRLVKLQDYQRAESLAESAPDSAFYYFNKVAGSTKDSLQIAMSYNGMAELQSDAGDYFGSQESLLTSLRYLDIRKKSDLSCISADDNELGLTSFKLNQWDAAITYYQQAFNLTDNADFQATILNNEGTAYQRKKGYNTALQLFDQAIAKVPANGKTYARIANNRAFTRWLMTPDYQPAAELLNALKLRLQLNDRWGQNSSYAHLSDYYLKSNPGLALQYSQAMYHVACEINSPGDQLEALRKMINLGAPNDAKRYFLIYQRINDSLQTAHDHAKNQFALIRYDAQKNKADYLSAQALLTRQRIWLMVALVTLLGVISGGFFIYRKRRRRLQLAAEQKIQESRLQISQTVHDVVANGLYRVMSELEHNESLGKEKLLDEIEDLYQRSRDISYEREVENRSFDEQLTDLLGSFSSDKVRIAATGNEPETWQGVSLSVQAELIHVLQELLVNMKKHSGASSVGFRFTQTADVVQIHYTDNGKGLPDHFNYGNGLRNTETRIKAIQGALTFENGEMQGLQIRIIFPVV